VPSSSFELRVRTAIHPEANTGLQGLFVRAGIYATAVRMAWADLLPLPPLLLLLLLLGISQL
jgi:hypothetical protein